MADETRVAAGKRFSRDMRRIREDRDVSVAEVHNETRIARSLIESFEEGGLYDHPSFNEVYLRSFVRAYAEAIGISPGTVVDELEEALTGAYEDALAAQYLDAPPDAPEESPSSESDTDEPSSDSPPEPSASTEEGERPEAGLPTAGGPEGRGGIVGPPRALDDEPDGESVGSPSSSTEAPQQNEQSEASDPSSQSGEEVQPTEGSSSHSDDATESNSSEDDDPASVPDTPDASSETPSWMEEQSEEETGTAPPRDESASTESPGREKQSASPHRPGGTGGVGEPTSMEDEAGDDRPSVAEPSTRSSSAPKTGPPDQAGGSRLQSVRRRWIWAGVGIVIVLFLMGGLGLLYFSSNEPSGEGGSETTAAPDTAVSSPSADTTTKAPAPKPPPLANVTLGDSIPLTVMAVDAVNEIRIRRDQDLRRPYWIEEGEAHVYPFRQRVTLENELDDVRLLLEGYPYPVSPQDTVGGLVVTRSEAEAFVDTLRGDPATLSVTPDTIPTGVPEQ